MPDPLPIHMLAGNDEYRAAESLDRLADHLRVSGVASCTMSRGKDSGDHLPNLDALASAQVLVVFCKRITLPNDQLQAIQDWCAAGRPIVGIRTASHAFQNWLAFDKDVLGGDYNGHGRDETVSVAVEPEAEDHPVLKGIAPWERPGKVYRNPAVAADVQVLLRAAYCQEAGQPLAWCRVYPPAGGRAFYTSMGHPHDFDDPRYLQLITNAIHWAAARTDDDPRTS